MKLRRICCLALCAALLTGCAAQPSPSPTEAPLGTLPPAVSIHDAPVGDAGLAYQRTVALSLPSVDGQQLLTVYEPLTLTYANHPAEAIARTLLAHEGTERVRSLGGGVTLFLAGTDPVAVSGGVCTVDLAPSVLQLSQRDLYTVCVALTATLCQLADVQQVVVLIAGQAPSMDITGSLPLGALTPQPGQELPVLYEQLTARRPPVGVDPVSVPITSAAALYFPLAQGAGIMPEARRLSFPGQHPQQMVLTLLDALHAGAETTPGASPMPDLASLMLSAPEVSELSSGGRRVTLHFVPDLEDRIRALGTDPACCYAALVTTLTTFIPSMQQVCIRIGDGALTSVRSERHGSALFPGGLHVRADYAGYLKAHAILWQQAEGRLTAVRTPVAYRRVTDPRTLLLTLMEAPETQAVLPDGITDADILGMAIAEDTLLIHLSDRCAAAIRESGLDQRLMAYAIVGTVCSHLPVRRVRFFFGGSAVEDLGGNVAWDGEFLHNPGLLPST